MKSQSAFMPDGAVGEAHQPFPRLAEELQELAAGLELLVVGQPAERRVELEEREVDELSLNRRRAWCSGGAC